MLKVLTSTLGLALLVAAPASVHAQSGSRPQQQDRQQQERQPSRQQEASKAPQKQAPRAAQQGQARTTQHAYGTWNSSWGARPGDPPKHWTRKSDWYRHVRACQQRFRSYNARTDTYRTHAGQTRRCTL